MDPFLFFLDRVPSYYMYRSAGDTEIPGARIVASSTMKSCAVAFCGFMCSVTTGCVAFNHVSINKCACALITDDIDMSSVPVTGTDWCLYRAKLYNGSALV